MSNIGIVGSGVVSRTLAAGFVDLPCFIDAFEVVFLLGVGRVAEGGLGGGVEGRG